MKDVYTDIIVLDISEKALERVRADLVRMHKSVMIVPTLLNFLPQVNTRSGHDRATFDFLTDESQIEKYVSSASANHRGNNFMTIGTFSEKAPEMQWRFN